MENMIVRYALKTLCFLGLTALLKIRYPQLRIANYEFIPRRPLYFSPPASSPPKLPSRPIRAEVESWEK